MSENYIYGDQSLNIPVHLNFGKFMLDKLRIWKNDVAIENPEKLSKLTYSELVDYTVSLAYSLRKLGAGVGDVIAVGSDKRNEFMPTTLAVILAGAAFTPFDIKEGRTGLQNKLNISKPKFLISSRSYWKIHKDTIESSDYIKVFITFDDDDSDQIPVNRLISEAATSKDKAAFKPALAYGQDVAVILYSSGTTGLSKGVHLTHLNCIVNSLPDNFNDESFKTIFLGGEWYHNYDVFMTFKFLQLGKRIVYVISVENKNEMILKIIQDQKVDVALTGPAVIGYLSKLEKLSDYNLDHLKIIYSRSSPLHVKTMEKLKNRLPNLKHIIQGYGLTECGEPTSETWSHKGPRLGSIGMASPGITIKIIDIKTNAVCGPNQHGEIRLAGPPRMKGYAEIDPSTYLDEEGFLKTGDLGYYDDDKYFYIVDRIKEIFIYNGFNVHPVELETLLLLHPGVKEAGVVGRPDPDVGEIPTAFVVRNPGSSVTETELQDYIKGEVTSRMWLDGGVIFLDEIPRNASGKILRRRLREMLNTTPTDNDSKRY